MSVLAVPADPSHESLEVSAVIPSHSTRLGQSRRLHFRSRFLEKLEQQITSPTVDGDDTLHGSRDTGIGRHCLPQTNP